MYSRPVRIGCPCIACAAAGLARGGACPALRPWGFPRFALPVCSRELLVHRLQLLVGVTHLHEDAALQIDGAEEILPGATPRGGMQRRRPRCVTVFMKGST
jgi:hypothetical protein